MFTLQRLRAEHASALLTFEVENRAFFAASIRDRGDDYFANFDAGLEALLAEQADGISHFHVLVDDEGAVVGRVNLIDAKDGTAELGYRIAERVTGRGVATSAVAQVCALARDEYGLDTLRAGTSRANVASRAVLTRTGFVPVEETTFDGHPGTWFELRLDT